jgi:uncharacterized protein YjbI with pentapeptide repeats
LECTKGRKELVQKFQSKIDAKIAMGSKGAFERVDDWTNRNRPRTLLATVALTIAVIALVNWAAGTDLFRQFFFPQLCDPKSPHNCDPLEWKELFQAAVLVLGLPVAFLLWHWRDRNVRDQIENARKDTNLKEFQEVQLRSVGIMPEACPASAKRALQIAALHQLRSFVKGDYAKELALPSFELYCALLAEPLQKNAKAEGLPKPIFDTLRNIVNLEWKAFFLSGFPLENRCFDNVSFCANWDLSGLNFFGSTFREAEFVGVRLVQTSFSRCDFENTRFDFCNLDKAGLYQASLRGVRMSTSCLRGASLLEVDPRDMHWLIGCEYDDETSFGRPDDKPQMSLQDVSNSVARAHWIAKGLQLTDGCFDHLWLRKDSQ